jgi:hypothetical protein
MKMRPTQPEWTTGLCGSWRRRRDAPCNTFYLFTSFLLRLYYMYARDPYPKNNPQRELGTEDLCFGLARRGGARFPFSLS